MDIELADNKWVILAAYVAAFLPWALISSSFDFISPVWKTVRDTWIEGLLVIFYSTIPVGYIMFYIILQAQAEDFKEMFAAFVALLFSILYILRAIWGLWKLQCFRHWAARSIINLRKLGIEYKRADKESGTPEDAFTLADGLFVNDTIIDNQLSHGSCPCFLQYGSQVFQLSSNSQHGFWRRFLVLPARLLFPAGLLFYILKDLAGGKYRFKLQLIPEKPVEVWLNWAVVFASQGLKEWINDFSVARAPERRERSIQSNTELFNEHRRYFAGEVLASAALHFWPPRPECNTISPMLWGMWAEDSDVVDGKVSKKEMLRDVIQSGKGLPFSARHDLPKGSHHDHLEGYVQSYDYAAFSRQLRRIVASVPAGFGDWIEKFDKEKLEWLAIMLSLGAYASDLEAKYDSYATDESSLQEFEDNNLSEDGKSYDGDESVEQLDCKDLAVENLLEQLGLDKEYTGSARDTSIRSLCAFPLPDSCLDRVSGCNRLVMRVGEMIDIWCALEAGRQILFLKDFEEPWELYCRGYRDAAQNGCPNHKAEGDSGTCGENCGLEQKSQEGVRMTSLTESERMFEAHGELERARLRFQLAKMSQRYWHMEQTISFMGYGMEFVRTELAAWKQRNERSDAEVWKAKFGKDSGNGACIAERIDLGLMITGLMTGVPYGKGLRHLQKRSVQSRIIWELQRGLERAYKRNSRGPNSVELMMLCVICFPSVSVTVEEESTSTDLGSVVETRVECAIMFNAFWGGAEGEVDTDCCYQIVITPQCAPQEVAVVANLMVSRKKGVEASAILRGCVENEHVCFMWEWWRDAFTARLDSVRRWQDDHEFATTCEVRRTKGSIASCVQKGPKDDAVCPNPYYTWTGWLPFRTHMCRFELESPKFLWHYKESGDRDHIFESRGGTTTTLTLTAKTYCCVSYEDVGREQLRHFNFVIREVGFIQPDRGEQSNGNEGGSVVAKAASLFDKGPEHFARAVFLLETAATERQDIDALNDCVHKLVTEGETQDIERAIRVLENCTSTILPHNLGKISEDKHDDVIGRIKPLLGIIVRKDGYSERSARAMSVFMTATCAINRENTFDALRIMEALFFRSRSLSSLWLYLELLMTEYNEAKTNMMRARIITEVSSDIFPKSELAPSMALYQFVSKCYWRAASQGQNVRSKTSLALHLECGGKGVAADAARAKGLYEDAIKEGRDVRAMYNLAVLLQKGADGVASDAIRAKRLYEEAIKEERDVSAMYNLAVLLQNGAEGVAVDAVRAKELYEDAIKEGHDVRAMYNLAVLLVDGAKGVASDPVRAKELFEDAVKEEHLVKAMNNLAVLLVNGAEGVAKDAVRAKGLYEDAIKHGCDVEAMNNLALLLVMGAEGVAVDPPRSKKLWEDAIEEGRNVEAMNNLGFLLQSGAEGVAADTVRAKRLYEDAIDEGRHVGAMNNLASLLEHGAEGVARDWQRALELRLQAQRES